MNPTSIALTISDGQPRADSRLLAEGFGIQHKNLLATIREHAETLSGTEPLQTATAESGIAPDRVSHYLLTERQALVLATICRLTPETLGFRLALTDAFLAMRERFIRTLAESTPALPATYLEAQVEAAAPKVAFVDTVIAGPNDWPARDVAKMLGVGCKALIEALLAKGWYYRDKPDPGRTIGRLRAYAERIHDGHCREVVGASTRDGGKVDITPHITAAGVVLIRRRLVEWGLVEVAEVAS